jgi:putative heme-binding domain-containing protein
MDVPELRAVCEKTIGNNALARVSALGLSKFNDPAIGQLIAARLSKTPPDVRKTLTGVLVSRPAWAHYLLDAVAAGQVNRTEISASEARQMAASKDEALSAQLKKVWGEVRASSAARQELIAKWKTKLSPAVVGQANPAAGREVFQQVCAACHKMYGKGGEIGPDLTGSDRRNLDYLLENIADPNAVVTPDFRLNTVTMKDGRILSGMIGTQTPKTFELKTFAGSVTVERSDASKTEESPLSMMPEGLLEAFSESQVRDLFSFLMSEAAPQ